MKCNSSVKMFFYGKQDNRVQKVSSLHDILGVLMGLCNIASPTFVDEYFKTIFPSSLFRDFWCCIMDRFFPLFLPVTGASTYYHR